MIIWRDVEKVFVQIQHLFFTREKKKKGKILAIKELKEMFSIW